MHPGEVLREDYLNPLEWGVNALAKQLGNPISRPNDIVLPEPDRPLSTLYRHWRLTALRRKRMITRPFVCRLSQARAHGFAHPRPWDHGRMPRLKSLHSWPVSRARTTDKERYL